MRRRGLCEQTRPCRFYDEQTLRVPITKSTRITCRRQRAPHEERSTFFVRGRIMSSVATGVGTSSGEARRYKNTSSVERQAIKTEIIVTVAAVPALATTTAGRVPLLRRVAALLSKTDDEHAALAAAREDDSRRLQRSTNR